MNTKEFGGTGHGMPAPVSPEVAKRIEAQEAAKRKKQTEEFARNALPTTATQTVTVHESKHFPFQIIEITTTTNEPPYDTDKKPVETKQFKIGMCGQFVSERVFKDKEMAEKYISSRPWELITNMVCVTIKNAIEYEKSQSNS